MRTQRVLNLWGGVGLFPELYIKKINSLQHAQSVFKDMESQKYLRGERQEQRRWNINPLTLAYFFLLQFSEKSEVTICYQINFFHVITILLLPVKTLAGQKREYLTSVICNIQGLKVRI